MASNSVGSLFINIQARTAQLEVDMARVRGIIEGANSAMASQSGGAGMETSFRRGMVGAMLFRQAIREIVKEIGYVIENVEKIPGLNPEVVQSVITLRETLHDAKHDMDVLIADSLGFLSQWGQMIGVGLADAANKAAGRPEGDIPLQSGTADSRAADKDPAYWDKVSAATEKLTAARTKLANETSDLATKIQELQVVEKSIMEGERGMTGENTTTLAKVQSQTKLYATQYQIKVDLEKINKQLQASEDKYADAVESGSEREKPLWFQLVDAKRKLLDITKQVNDISVYQVTGVDKNGITQMSEDPAKAEELTEKVKKQTAARKELNDVMKKYGDLSTELGNAVASDLVDGMLKGEGMHQIFLKLIDDVIRLIVQQEIEKPLAAMFSTGFSMAGGAIMSLFMASGGPYVANQPFIAGENGPELVMPGTAGSVSDTASTTRGGNGGGDTNVSVTNHFGSGVTMQQLMGMMPSIVMQTRSSVLDGLRRGGALRYAITGGY